MRERPDEHRLLTRYFLGVASTVERDEVEARYFASDSEIETFLRAEDEVIDDYVRGAFSASERALFEKNFLCTTTRRQRLEFTKSLAEALVVADYGDFLNQAIRIPASQVTGGSQADASNVGPWADSQRVAFSRLLEWLDPVRERAAEKYEKIRTHLVRIFMSKGRADAEDLADQTIDRVAVALKSAQLKTSDPARYFLEVARYVSLEAYGQRSVASPVSNELIEDFADLQAEKQELAYSCLEKCLMQLSEKNRELIQQYYSSEGRPGINNRKELAKSLEVSQAALRIRVHRITTSLKECINACLSETELGTERPSPKVRS